MKKIENIMYSWACDLFPINRSIMGDGVRETLLYIKREIPELKIKKIKTGSKMFDWEVPNEWNVSDAYVEDENRKKIIDFKKNNLHLMSYSIPIDKWIDSKELNKHLYSIEDQPDAIPYVTSYYKKNWGFCLSHNQRLKLKNKKYHVVIKSSLKPGFLNYGELFFKGKSSNEIFLSTYVCHPSMANNEVSGPVVTLALSKYIKKMKNRNFSYRIIFIPETIGALAYLSKNHKEMKNNIKAGFILTCVGDNKKFSFMPSRLGVTLADKIANHIIKYFYPSTIKYSFLERGSDERQYCSPLIDLPIVSLMRSKYGTYKEYHTSDDNLTFISNKGLMGGYQINKKCIEALEINKRYIATLIGEPKMDKRGLRNSIGAPKKLPSNFKSIMDFLIYADGSELIDISEKINMNIFESNEIVKILLKEKLIKEIK